MGRDKALLPHPTGGSWLEHGLRQLAALQLPITLLSRWPEHRRQAEALALPQLEALVEPPPWEGPLLALHRLMARHPQQRLLLCPVDMPGLNRSSLEALLTAAAGAPEAIHLAHDGRRLQPLLGIYPNSPEQRTDLAAAIAAGERRLQGWITQQAWRSVPLDGAAIRNINHASDL
jgi:molybdopterin-guanine dinucleotide biosynthesis protein A